MRQLIITQNARASLKEIGKYTRARWGREQSLTYLAELESICIVLCEQPYLGRLREDLSPTLYSFPKESHVIFYRVKTNIITVVDILHQSEDIPAKF